MKPKKNKLTDVWGRIDKKSEDECWEWVGGKDTYGYGIIMIDQVSWRSHRVVYTLTYNTIPDKLCVLHSCDNPACCNPKHLWLGTKQDNSIDMVKKGRHCDVRGIKHGRCKLLERDVLEIRRLYSSGNYSKTELSKKYNVGRTQITRIINNESWKHILKEVDINVSGSSYSKRI